MDGMGEITRREADVKPKVALSIQLQVGVSDQATVMFQTHVDRDNVAERTEALDIVHVCAERLFYRYRVTALTTKINGNLISIDQERQRAERVTADYVRESAERIARRDALENDARQAFVVGGRRGDWKPDPATERKLGLIEQDQEKALEAHENHQRTANSSIEQLEHQITIYRMEIQQIEKLLNAA
jgi:adenine-specific DNA methylase